MQAIHPRKKLRSLRYLGLAVTLSLAFAAFTAPVASAVSISPAGAAFSMSGAGATWQFSTAYNKFVSCGKTEGTGWFPSSTKATFTMSMKSCYMPTYFGQSPCTSPGQSSGTMMFSGSSMRPVWLNAAHTEYGLLISPPESGILTEVQCIGYPMLQWKGGLLAKVTSPALGVQSNKATLAFRQSSGVGTYQYEIEEGPFKGGFGKPQVTEQGEGAKVALETDINLTFDRQIKFIP
jgi:hypothetical protein